MLAKENVAIINYYGCAPRNSHPPEIGISADVSIFETGFGRFDFNNI